MFWRSRAERWRAHLEPPGSTASPARAASTTAPSAARSVARDTEATSFVMDGNPTHRSRARALRDTAPSRRHARDKARPSHGFYRQTVLGLSLTPPGIAWQRPRAGVKALSNLHTTRGDLRSCSVSRCRSSPFSRFSLPSLPAPFAFRPLRSGCRPRGADGAEPSFFRRSRPFSVEAPAVFRPRPSFERDGARSPRNAVATACTEFFPRGTVRTAPFHLRFSRLSSARRRGLAVRGGRRSAPRWSGAPTRSLRGAALV